MIWDQEKLRDLERAMRIAIGEVAKDPLKDIRPWDDCRKCCGMGKRPRDIGESIITGVVGIPLGDECDGCEGTGVACRPPYGMDLHTWVRQVARCLREEEDLPTYVSEHLDAFLSGLDAWDAQISAEVSAPGSFS